MNISSIQREPKASDMSLEKLTTNTQVSEKDKLSEASRQFEALLLRNILSDTQKNSIDTKKKESATDSIYRDMITNQLADTISRSRSFGLANALDKDLGRQLLKSSDSKSSTTSTAATGTTQSL